MDTFFIVLQIIGAISFAISGAVVAIEHKMDLLGVILLGTITAVGGGIIRDTIIGNYPIEMFKNPEYALIGALTSLIVFVLFYFYHKLEITNSSIYKWTLTIFDAIGLGVFVVVGCDVASNIITKSDNYINQLSQPAIFLAITTSGVITAVGGGVIRDLLSMKMPNILTKYIYCLAVILEAFLYYLLLKSGLNQIVSAIISILFVILLRVIAHRFKLSLPKVNIESKETK